MNYHRVFIQNSYVHIILTSYDRQNVFIKNIETLRSAYKNTLKNYKFEIIAICVLPDHIHMILNPQNIQEYPKIISSMKYYFSRNVGQVCPTYNLKIGYIHKREKGIFQRRYFEHTIIDEKDLNNQIDYIHYNPVKHGYTKLVKEWKYSSFGKFVEKGLYDIDWGSPKNIEDFKDFNIE